MNSLPENPTAEDFFGASLQALEVECPQAYREICDLLAGSELLVELQDEQAVCLRFTTDKINVLCVDEPDPVYPLRLRSDWQTILDLVDARLSLLGAVYAGAVELTGKSHELVLLYEAILFYLRGGVRSPSFPRLLDEVRRVKGVCKVDII